MAARKTSATAHGTPVPKAPVRRRLRDAQPDEQPALSLSDAAYEEIKRRIVELELLPGSSFSEAELSAELGFGRTPTREALARLRREALVDVAPRSGYRVSGITLKGARDLFTIAAVLAGEAASQASQVPGAAEAMRVMQRGCALAAKDGAKTGPGRYLRSETELHLSLTKLTGNAMLEEMSLQVLEQMERLAHVMHRVRPQQPAVFDHAALIEALKDGDATRARDAAVAEVQQLQARVFDALISTDAVTSAAIGLR